MTRLWRRCAAEIAKRSSRGSGRTSSLPTTPFSIRVLKIVTASPKASKPNGPVVQGKGGCHEAKPPLTVASDTHPEPARADRGRVDHRVRYGCDQGGRSGRPGESDEHRQQCHHGYPDQ